jgi:hypothetical protein
MGRGPRSTRAAIRGRTSCRGDWRMAITALNAAATATSCSAVASSRYGQGMAVAAAEGVALRDGATVAAKAANASGSLDGR